MISKSRHSLCACFVGISALVMIAISINTSFAIEPVEVAKLWASDGEPGDEFGRSVAVSGNTAVIGTYIIEHHSSGKPGCAYIFVHDGADWIEHSKLVGSDVNGNDLFGFAVSVDSDTVVIGAYSDDEVITNSGAVYVFIRDGDVWTKQAKLKAPNPVSGKGFGIAVEIVGDTILIGEQNSASAYVFTRNSDTWTHQATLSAGLSSSSSFGQSLSLENDTAVIGAYRYTHGEKYNSGAAYVFVRNGDSWSQQAGFIAGNAYDYFGKSVSLSGDTLLIGASGVDVNAENAGAAYVFLRDGENWTYNATLIASDGAIVDQFGWSIDLNADTALIGAFSDDIDTNPNAGSAYIFKRNGETWVEAAKLIPSDSSSSSSFGWSVSMDGSIALIGANRAFEDARGAAYVFSLASEETPPGQDILVYPPPTDENGEPIEDAPDISLKFGDIEEGGETNVVITEPGPGTTSAPSGYRIMGLTGRPLVFDIDTTATLAEGSSFEVCIDYSAFDVAGDPSNLTLSHEVDGHWVDITSSNDTTNMILCGTADSFSYFAILEAGSTVISCLAPNGAVSIDGQPYAVLVEGQSEEFQVQPEGSTASLWSCGWVDGCKWLQYHVHAGSAWNILTSEGGMLIMERAAQEPVPEFALQWGSFGSNPGEFNMSHGVEADHFGNVYVTERGNHRIQKFDAEGNFIQTFGSFGSGPGQFILPNEIAFDSLGDLYATDEGNCRVQKFTSEGDFIHEWGNCGGGPGQFSLAWGIAIDSSDQVFVSDTFNYRIQVFDTDGNYLREWGVQGAGNGEFEGPRGIAVDAKNTVIVVDEGNHRIQKFENNGTYLTQWGSFGNANGEFTWPHAVATDIVGNVFVGDIGNPWVQKFDKDGNFLVRWGNWGEFSGDQTGLDVSPNGLIYVGDFHLSRVRVYGTKAEIVIEPGTAGEVETTDGQLSISIPGDALSESETISVVQSLPEEPQVDVQIGESGGSGEVLAAYDLEPDGLVFDNPVTLTMTADVTALNQDQRDALDIYLFSDTDADGTPDTFVALGAVCHVSDGPVFVATCTAEIAHFSTYGLIAPIDADQDGVADFFGGIEDQCSGTAIPESVPTKHLGFNRWALVNADTVFDTKLAENDASDNPYTLADTAGCSCEQIIEALELGTGQTKFGCSSSVMNEWVSSLSQ